MSQENLNQRHILQADQMIQNRGYENALHDALVNLDLQEEHKDLIYWRSIVEYLISIKNEDNKQNNNDP